MKTPPEIETPSPLAGGNGAKEVDRCDAIFSDHIPASLAPASLADEHWRLPLPSDAEFEKLHGLGISDAALWSPYPIRAANVIFHDHLFDFANDGGGQRAFILRCDDAGYCTDLCAWRADRIATHHGVGFALGDRDQVHSPAACALGGKLRIHRNPVEWLKAGRGGIVILRQRWAYGELQNVPAFAVADEAQRLELLRLLEPPKSKARIFIDVSPGVKAGAAA